jgi:hypothetical protein
MTFAQVIEYFGTQVAVARALHMTQGAISPWQHSGIPSIRQIQIQTITGGKLLADAESFMPTPKD